jgi:hypothetical protein
MPSLTRGYIYNLQLLLGLASGVILESEYSRTYKHILLSQIRDFHNMEGQVPKSIVFQVEVDVEVTLRLTANQSVRLGVEPTLRLVIRYYFPFEGCCLKAAILSLCGALSD